ncbi:MAG: CHAT domain-containing protein [bacterium]
MLKNSLANFVELEQAYFKLVELSLLEKELDSIVPFLQQLSGKSIYKRNSYYALAKIHRLNKEPGKAYEAFSNALSFGAISPGLLKDFLELSILHKNEFDWQARIRHAEIGRHYAMLASALANHFNSKHRRAAEILALLPDSLRLNPQILHLYGTCCYDQSLYEKADSLWTLGLIRARKTGNLQAEAQFLTSLGVTASQVFFDDDSAAKCYSQAEQIAVRIGDLSRQQMVLGNRAMIKEEYSEKIADYREAIKIAEQIKSYDDAANWYMGMAQSYFAAEQFTDALQANEKGIMSARSVADKSVLLKILRDKGDFLFDLRQDSLARVTYQEVYDLAKTKNRIQQRKSVNARLADYLLRQKKYTDARKAYLDFIAILPENADYDWKAYWRGKVAESFKLEGRFDLARIEYNRAIQVATDGGDALYENWLGLEIAKLDLREGKIHQAIEKCGAIIDYATESQDDQLSWQTNFVLGKAFKARGNLKMAISSLRKAANLIEKTRHSLSVDQLQISYFSEAEEVYRQIASCYLKKNQSTNARADLDSLFYFTQLTRGRTLNQLGLQKRISQKSAQHDEEYRQLVVRLRGVQRQLRDHPEKQAELQSELNAARLALVTKRLRLSGEAPSDGKDKPADAQWLAPVEKYLAKQEAGLLLYHIANDTSFVFAMANDSVKIVGLDVKPDAVRASVNHLMAPFHEVHGDSVQFVKFRAGIAHQLYKKLMRDVENSFKNRLPENLLIIPDIALMNLPFEMLLTREQEKASYTPVDAPEYENDFLLHRYTISYSPSLAFLQDDDRFWGLAPKMLILANPFADAAITSAIRWQRGWRFNALPYAEDEANKIRAIYENRTKIFIRDQATKAIFKEHVENHRLIHFATHAFADRTFDAFSGLVLAATSDTTDDGLLMGYEIADLLLQAELITLSACETGRGLVVSGEGVLGLPRLFLGAGAKSVLMTRWVIDDKFASQLLPMFYEFCLNQSSTKARALAEAKRQVFHDKVAAGNTYLQHPFYWASYTLYGNPGKIQSTNSWFLILIVIVIVSFAVFAGCRWWFQRKGV